MGNYRNDFIRIFIFVNLLGKVQPRPLCYNENLESRGMDNFAQQIFTILVTQPGNLVYHLILAFSVVAGLQAAMIARRNNPAAVPGRAVLGLSILLVAQLALFLSSGLAWQQVADPQRYLPPLDRAITAFSLVWIIWLWCFPAPSRAADAVTAILSLVVIILGLFTVNSWMLEDPALPFNGSWYDMGWQIFCLALAGLGLLVLFIGRPPAWGTGLAVLGLILAGYVANLLLARADGYFSGVVRLSQLCAYPLLPVLAHRLVRLPAPPPAPAPDATRAYDPRLMFSWLQTAAETAPARLSAALARAIGQTMLADLCFLVDAPDEYGRWALTGGHDLVSEQDLPAATFESEQIPTLSAALQRGRSVRLPMPGQPENIDLKALGQAFSLDDAGTLLAAPLIDAGKVLGGIVLLSPYKNRDWSGDEQSQLMSVAEAVVAVLQRKASAAAAPAVLPPQVETLQRENRLLLDELAVLRSRPAATPATLPAEDSDLDALMAIQKESQDTILRQQDVIQELQQTVARLQSELGGLPAASPAAPVEAPQAEMELRLALEDNAYLRKDLADALARIETLQRATRAGIGGDSSELIAGISQELRQPMNFLTSYADILLSETSGALDDTQIGYLDRIKTSLDRMRTLLDDLTAAASLHLGEPLDTSIRIDLATVLDDAVNAMSSLFAEKNINFYPDLPERFSPFYSDPGALRQVVVDLLRNALSFVPEGGGVVLRARTEPIPGGVNLALEVKDSGTTARAAPGAALNGGGYGLSITRALVEALGGKIWLESDAGRSATYFVQLPSGTPHPTGRE